MMSLAPVPTMVAFVQASTALPMLLFRLAAGALADVVDRRRLLLFTQGWMLVIDLYQLRLIDSVCQAALSESRRAVAAWRLRN